MTTHAAIPSSLQCELWSVKELSDILQPAGFLVLGGRREEESVGSFTCTFPLCLPLRAASPALVHITALYIRFAHLLPHWRDIACNGMDNAAIVRLSVLYLASRRLAVTQLLVRRRHRRATRASSAYTRLCACL